MNVLVIFFGAVFVNNFVMNRFLGICPLLGTSRKVETAFGMGMAVTFVMALSSAVTFTAYNYILVPMGLEYLYIVAFILIIASLVQLVEMFVKKSSPGLYRALGVYLPLITTNCAVLGAAVINIREEGFTLFDAIIQGTGAAIGFTLVIVLFAGIRERLELSNIPKPFQGFPIALIAAGLMSLAFLGFQGMM